MDGDESEKVEVPEKKNLSGSEGKVGLTSKMRENPWILSTLVLGLLCLTLFVGNLNGGVTGNVISGNDAGEKLLDFYVSNGASGLTLDSVEEASGVYQVNFEYQGSIVPVYVTKDGKLAGSLSTIALSSSSDDTVSEEVPKSDNPEVELFIWGYCPYGVQAQGPMAEVASLLGDVADFKAVMYYDGHGAYETQQNKIQECIQEVSPDKYWDYADKFVSDIYPICSSERTEECDLTESTKIMNSLGIDSDAVLDCVDSKGEDLISDASSRAGALGVTGSPTVVINGVPVSVSRNAESIKSAVCETFNNAPSECSEVLDSGTTAASGSC